MVRLDTNKMKCVRLYVASKSSLIRGEQGVSNSARERAAFCFTVYEKGDRDKSRLILQQALPLAASHRSFQRFVAYVEIPEKSVAKTHVDPHVEIGEYECRVFYIKANDVKRLSDQKMADEAKARQQRGHVSYRPADVLPTNTCVITIGSRPFCIAIANVHMQEIRELQRKLINILTRVGSLPEYVPRATLRREDFLMVSVGEDPKFWLTYNLCWMHEHSQRESEIVGVIDFPQNSHHGRIE